MADYIIATVSTADLEREWLDAHGVPFISYTFIIDDEEYVDDCRTETREMVYNKMNNGSMPSTSQISEYAYAEFFRSLLSTGKDVIFVDMSRAISNSIHNAEQAMEKVTAEFPDRKFHFIDSFCITGGLYILIKRLVSMKEDGAGFDEVVAWGEANKKNYIHHFMVENLEWLRRGGRVSNASAFFGTLLSIKPILYVADNGSLVVCEKIRGRKKAMAQMLEDTLKDIDPENGYDYTIGNADCREDAQALANMLMEKYPQVKHVDIMDLGPVICAHCGPGWLAIFYHGKDRFI